MIDNNINLAPAVSVWFESYFPLTGIQVQKTGAAGLGFEPRLTAPKTAVLPLDDPANQGGLYRGDGRWGFGVWRWALPAWRWV